MIDLDVMVGAGDWPKSEIEPLVRRAAAAAIEAVPDAPEGPLEAALLLTDDAEVRELNRAWRDQDRPTNVLSFPTDVAVQPGQPRHIGDIALAYETVAGEAAAEGKTLLAHAAHLVVHGILHLLGQDHLDEADAERMERTEVEALARLDLPDPYARISA